MRTPSPSAIENLRQPSSGKPLRIGRDGPHILVPALPELERVFQIRTVVANASRTGSCMERQREPLFQESDQQEGVLKFPRALQPVLCRHLIPLGYQPSQPPTRGIAPTAGQWRFGAAIEMVRDNEQGLLRDNGSFDRRIDVLEECLAAFPDQRFLIVASRVRDVEGIARRLARRDNDATPDVQAYHRRAKVDRKVRIAISTWDMAGHHRPVDAESRDIVILWDAADLALPARRDNLAECRNARIYGFAKAGLPMAQWVKAWLGFKDADVTQPDRRARASRRILIPTERVGSHEAQCARLAQALAAQPEEELRRLVACSAGYLNAGSVEVRDDEIPCELGIVLLADGLQAAKRLARQLDWPVAADPKTDRADQDRELLVDPREVLRGRSVCVATPSGLKLLDAGRIGVVIRADRRPGVPELAADWRLEPPGDRLAPLWWIDLVNPSAQKSDFWARRSAEYVERGIPLLSISPYASRVWDFLCDLREPRRARTKKIGTQSPCGYVSIQSDDKPIGNQEAARRRLQEKKRRHGGVAVRTRGTDRSALENVLDSDALLQTFDRLARKGGKAPGPDGISYGDVSRHEIAKALRLTSQAIREGRYRPAEARVVSIPKDSGGTRELRLRNIVDRIVANRVAEYLTPLLDPKFDTRSFGFRPDRDVAQLFHHMEWLAEKGGLVHIAIDDVRKAFDNVPIPKVPKLLERSGIEPKLVDLATTILKGENELRKIGIDQGSALSPLILNLLLDHALDQAIRSRHPGVALLRYADNLIILAKSALAAEEAMQTARESLNEIGMTLKGPNDPAKDLRDHDVTTLGWTLRLVGRRLRYVPDQKAWNKLEEALKGVAQEKNPDQQARSTVLGMVNHWGAACTPQQRPAIIDRTLAMLERLGYREAIGRDELKERCHAAYQSWAARRKSERGILAQADLQSSMSASKCGAANPSRLTNPANLSSPEAASAYCQKSQVVTEPERKPELATSPEDQQSVLSAQDHDAAQTIPCGDILIAATSRKPGSEFRRSIRCSRPAFRLAWGCSRIARRPRGPPDPGRPHDVRQGISDSAASEMAGRRQPMRSPTYIGGAGRDSCAPRSPRGRSLPASDAPDLGGAMPGGTAAPTEDDFMRRHLDRVELATIPWPRAVGCRPTRLEAGAISPVGRTRLCDVRRPSPSGSPGDRAPAPLCRLATRALERLSGTGSRMDPWPRNHRPSGPLRLRGRQDGGCPAGRIAAPGSCGAGRAPAGPPVPAGDREAIRRPPPSHPGLSAGLVRHRRTPDDLAAPDRGAGPRHKSRLRGRAPVGLHGRRPVRADPVRRPDARRCPDGTGPGGRPRPRPRLRSDDSRRPAGRKEAFPDQGLVDDSLQGVRRPRVGREAERLPADREPGLSAHEVDLEASA
jgi:RNA-directed DNA polymerase